MVLAQPAYRTTPATNGTAPDRSLWQIGWDWFVQHVVAPLFGPLAHAVAAGSSVGTAIGLLLVTASLALLAVAIVRLALAFVRVGGARRDVDASSPLASGRSAVQWRAIARDAAKRGDTATAIAALWAAALVLLDDASLVAFDASRTPGEYRRLVARLRGDAAAPFDELGSRFVRAAFASETPEPSAYAAAERALDDLEPALAP